MNQFNNSFATNHSVIASVIWFFIGYWIKTGLDLYPGPFFMK